MRAISVLLIAVILLAGRGVISGDTWKIGLFVFAGFAAGWFAGRGSAASPAPEAADNTGKDGHMAHDGSGEADGSGADNRPGGRRHGGCCG